MSALVPLLKEKIDVDIAIRGNEDKLVLLRFGTPGDAECVRLDDMLMKCAPTLDKMASVYFVDPADIPVYASYFDIRITPAVLFFFNAVHMRIDAGTPDSTKWIGAFASKQDLIDLVEVLYRSALRGKTIAKCPIDPDRVPKYDLFSAGV